jgi:nucleoside-triphosphatase THEP1
MFENPFIPSFGDLPPILVGRDSVVADIRNALEKGRSDPYRSVLFTGARGAGKTVMLLEVAEIAGNLGYIVVNVTAGKNLLTDIIEQIIERSTHLLPKAGRQITGVSIGKFSVSYESNSADDVGFRITLERIVSQLNDNDIGVLFLIDEVTKYAKGLEELLTTYQIFKGEKRNVALMMAGLPDKISEILSDDNEIKNLTFLRRAERIVLNDVPIVEVREAFKIVIENNGRSASIGVLDKMSTSTKGYPFMIQLIGYYTWRNNATRKKITEDDVEVGILEANRRLGTLVYGASLNDLSDVDRRFLSVMAKSDFDTKIAYIASELGVSTTYAGQYRIRLLETGLITKAGHGKLDFALPYLREYIRGLG